MFQSGGVWYSHFSRMYHTIYPSNFGLQTIPVFSEQTQHKMSLNIFPIYYDQNHNAKTTKPEFGRKSFLDFEYFWVPLAFEPYYWRVSPFSSYPILKASIILLHTLFADDRVALRSGGGSTSRIFPW